MQWFNKNKSIVLTILQAFFVYGWLVNLQKTDSNYGIYIFIAVLSLFALQKNTCRAVSWPCAAFSMILSGAVLLANYSLFSPWNIFLNLLNAAVVFIGGCVAFYQILAVGLVSLPCMTMKPRDTRAMPVFWISFSAIAAVYLCYLFFYGFPGMLSNDSVTTIHQILSGTYNNILPYWHTKMIGLFLHIGYALFGKIDSAIAFYISIQALLLATAFAYCIVTLYQIGIPKWVITVVLLCYAFLPYHIAYSIHLWKDVLFGAAALVFVTALYRIFKHIGKSELLNYTVLLVGTAGLSLCRTNGWYAMAVTILILIFAVGRKYKKVLYSLIIVELICGFLIGPCLSIMNIPGSDFIEALAIPFQQVARVVAYDYPITEEETQIIDQAFDLQLVKEVYDPKIVDPIKFTALDNKELFKENIGQYCKLWLKLGVRYPDVYLQAWVDTTKGYWNGGYDYWIHLFNLPEHEMGADMISVRQSMEKYLGVVQTESRNPLSTLFRLYFTYMEIPAIMKPLYAIGLHVWIVLVCCFLCVVKKREEFILTIPIIVIVAGLWVGTPVYAEFRYAYPVFTTVPMIVCATIFNCNGTGEQQLDLSTETI